MNDQITLPAEVVEEYYASDCARVLVAPPVGVPSPDWVGWAHEAFPLPVTRVERVSDSGRLLLAVTLGEFDEDEGAVKTPKTFRLALPITRRENSIAVSINLNGVSDWTPPPTIPL